MDYSFDTKLELERADSLPPRMRNDKINAIIPLKEEIPEILEGYLNQIKELPDEKKPEKANALIKEIGSKYLPDVMVCEFGKQALESTNDYSIQRQMRSQMGFALNNSIYSTNGAMEISSKLLSLAPPEEKLNALEGGLASIKNAHKPDKMIALDMSLFAIQAVENMPGQEGEIIAKYLSATEPLQDKKYTQERLDRIFSRIPKDRKKEVMESCIRSLNNKLSEKKNHKKLNSCLGSLRSYRKKTGLKNILGEKESFPKNVLQKCFGYIKNILKKDAPEIEH